MKRCETCAHWGREGYETWEADEAGMKVCARAGRRWEIMDGANNGRRDAPPETSAEAEQAWARRRVEALRAAMMYADDGSEYAASFVTSPDFGCVLHSAAVVVVGVAGDDIDAGQAVVIDENGTVRPARS